jgi:NADH-quinone oxidoreductase subunit G
MRIMPRTNEVVNEEWISDKTRFIWDGLRSQRLDRPYLRVDGKLKPVTWPEAFAAIAAKVKSAGAGRIGAIAGDLAASEELFALKDLVTRLGSANLDARQDGAKLDPSVGRASYLFNPGIAGIDEADAILLVGTNPRREAAVLNARLRKRWRAGVRIAVIGEKADLTYSYDYLGAGPDSLADLTAGKNAFADVLKGAKKPLIIAGAGISCRVDGEAAMAQVAGAAVALGVVKDGWNGFAVLHTAASRVGALDLGFVPGPGGLDAAAMAKAGALDVLFLLGADEIAVGTGAFVVYQGSHGDRGANRADVILPGAAYTEKSGLYVNTEGRVQLGNRATFPPGDAREDWAILRALSEALGAKLPYDSLNTLRVALVKAHPHFAAIDTIAAGDAGAVATLGGKAGTVDRSAYASAVADFYLTNPIARASAVMAQCSQLAAGALPIAAE